MPSLLLAIALCTSLLSATALYARSPHCRLRALGRLAPVGGGAGVLLALASLALWIHGLGVGAGISVMLGSGMLALVALAYLGAWLGTTPERGRR